MMPYHLFVYEGRPFVYHLGLGKCLSVSPDAYELLTLRQTMSKEEATKAFLAKRPDAEAVVRETETLEDCGFFEPAETGFETDDENSSRRSPAATKRIRGAIWSCRSRNAAISRVATATAAPAATSCRTTD